MARLARFVLPGAPHHVTQRGNRRQPTFFSDDDYRRYLALIAEGCRDAGVACWAYCLMPNHVHLILAPEDEGGLRRALGEAHRRYTREINQREGWRGYLWQGRFASFPMDEAHLLACARYVELNPVRARLVERPEDWRWSSAAAHLAGRDDALVDVAPLLERVGDWRALLDSGLAEGEHKALQASERTGRPLGEKAWLEQLQEASGRVILPRKAGRPRAEKLV